MCKQMHYNARCAMISILTKIKIVVLMDICVNKCIRIIKYVKKKH